MLGLVVVEGRLYVIWCRRGLWRENWARRDHHHGRVKRTGVLTRCTASSSFPLPTLHLYTFPT